MYQDPSDELNAEEREALKGLDREKLPPPFLEERVVAALKGSDLVVRASRRWPQRALRIGLPLAASLAIFFLGTIAGMTWNSRTPVTNGPQFMLVLRNRPETVRPRSPEELKRVVQEYSGWARQLREQGVRVQGEKLKDESRILEERAGDQSLTGQRSVERISGYFLVAARDYDEAVRIASGHPHLKYGGAIEVREIDRF